MPFKRAGWLQPDKIWSRVDGDMFQCPLSGQVGCNDASVITFEITGVSMPFKRAGWLQPSSAPTMRGAGLVSMPFKRAGWLQRAYSPTLDFELAVSMPFKRFQIYKTPRLRRGVLVPKSCCS